MRAERILFVDMYNVIIAQNSLPAVEAIVDHNTYPVGTYLTTVNQIRILVDKFKPTKILLTFDGPEAGERRRQLLPTYKNKRIIKKRESKVQIMNGDDNIVYGVEGAYQNQLIKIYEFIKLLPATMIMLPYAEADDVIAYLVKKNKADFDCIIVSNDKDYLQLIDENVYVYRWRVKKLYGIEEFTSEFKITPENYIFRKVSLGDTVDKVPGIKGIGEKTFTCLEETLLNKKIDNIEEFYDTLQSLDKTTLKTRERNAINESLEQKDLMTLAYKLMKLDENCLINEQAELLGMQIEEQKEKTLLKMTARILMNKLPFNKLSYGFNSETWLQTFSFLKPNVEIKY